MVLTVSVQHVKDAMQQQRQYAPQRWEESARRSLHVEDLPLNHTVGQADMGKLVVLEGAEYWACVRVDKRGLEWIIVTVSKLKTQQSRGPAFYGVPRECLRFMGPVCRTYRCTPRKILQAPAVFVEVMQPLRLPGHDVSPVAPSNMWQAEHAAAMSRALQGQATALPRASTTQLSSKQPAASLALLHGGSGAGCWVIVAKEPQSSALRMYDRGENATLTVRPADLVALHLGILSSKGGTALYLQGTVVGSAAVRIRRQCG